MHLDLSSLSWAILTSIFIEKDQLNIDIPFIIDLLKGTILSLVSIDELIDQASINGSSRMDAIDRAILRIACYELAIKKKLAPKVIKLMKQ